MMIMTQPVAIRRLEALFVMAAALVVYHDLGLSWSMFAVFFMLPDLSILWYRINPKWGGAAYNMAHCFAFPVVLGVVAFLQADLLLQQVALIWLAHCAFDRAIGWGLKFDDSFCHTDMGMKTLPVPNKYLA